MEVVSVIALIHLEILAAVISATSFSLFLRAYYQSRKQSLALFSASFAALAVGMSALFGGQLLASYGRDVYAYAFSVAALLSLILHGTLVAIASASLLKRKGMRNALAIVVGALAVLAAYQILGPGTESGFVAGVYHLQLTPLATISSSLTFVASIFVTLVVANALRNESAKLSRGDGISSMLFVAASLGLATVIFVFISQWLSAYEIVHLALLSVIGYSITLSIAAYAAEDGDPAVHRRPTIVFLRSLVFKSVVGISAILVIVTFTVHGVISSYYIRERQVTLDSSLGVELDRVVKSLEGSSAQLRDEVSRLALLAEPVLLENAEGVRDARLDALTTEFVWRRSGTRLVRILSPDGSAVYSSDPNLKNSPLNIGESESLALAARGEVGVSTEMSSDGERWVIRSASRIGNTGRFAVIESGLASLFSLEQLPEPFIGAIGYGLIGPKGEQIVAIGNELDQLAKQQVIGRAHSGGQARFSAEDIDFAVQRIAPLNGTRPGTFYVAFRQDHVQIGVFRVLALITLLLMMAVIVSIGVVIFGISYVLRPIRALRAAAEHIEHERYDVEIEYRGVDELAQMARAFNSMQSTISHRTDELRNALKEQVDFIDHTVREIRNPINIFRWTLELMRFGDTGKLNKEQLELLEQLNQANERLLKMVQNMRDAIKIDQKRLVMKLEPVIIEDIIDAAIGEFAVEIRSKGLSMHWIRPKVGFPSVRADRTYIMKAVHNLVANAVKYTPKGGHVEVELEVSPEQSPGGKKGRYVTVKVEDNGIGIPKNEQGKLFRRFQRAKNVVAGEIAGAGLGLFITKNVVELHGGSVWFHSKEGVGTTFYFSVPVDDLSGRIADSQDQEKE